jgi:hypothetical protein
LILAEGLLCTEVGLIDCFTASDQRDYLSFAHHRLHLSFFFGFPCCVTFLATWSLISTIHLRPLLCFIDHAVYTLDDLVADLQSAPSLTAASTGRQPGLAVDVSHSTRLSAVGTAPLSSSSAASAAGRVGG